MRWHFLLLKGLKPSIHVHRRQLREELPSSKLCAKFFHSAETGTQSERLRGGGERAIQLAIQCARTPKSIPAGVTDGMSAPELKLFFDVFKYHRMIFSVGGVPELNHMHSFREIARGLDSGGLELSNEELLHNHLHGLAICYKDSQTTEKKTFKFINPGVDDIAAQHVCTLGVSQLQPVDIDQLDKGMINQGKILWVVSKEPCFRISGLNMLIQDRTGRLATLSLYNSISSHATSFDAQSLFPVGTRLGIKEPYYKMQNSGKFGLRSDNPCNVIIELPKDDTVSLTSDSLKKAGNKFLEEKRFDEAAEHYGLALMMAGAAAVQLPLYLNRAAARLGCKDFLGALADSKAALAIDGCSVKGKYHMGQAFFGLRRFTDARDVFASLAEDPGCKADEAYAEQLRKAAAAIEQSAGRYDLMTFPFAPDKQGEADVAEFFGPIEVRWTEGRRRGRGLFLTADAKAGQLLFVERPMAYSMEDSKTTVHAVNMDKTVNKGSQHGLINNLTLLAHRDPRINALLAHLSTGEPGEQCPLLDVGALRPGGAGPTPAGPVSAFAVKQMVKINAFEIKFRLDPGPVGRRALEQAMRNPVTHDLGSTTPAFATGPPLATRRQRRKAHLDRAISGSITTLHHAVALGDERACVALLAAGASANDKDRLGSTPLHLATGQYHNQVIAAALIDHGAELDAQDTQGYTPLHGAVRLERREAVQLLLLRGANPHTENYIDGSCPLDMVDPHHGLGLAGGRAMLKDFKDAGLRVDLRTGSALWAVASMMNHATQPSTERRFLGQMMFVSAGRDLQAGEELTTSYSLNPESLRHWNIVE